MYPRRYTHTAKMAGIVQTFDAQLADAQMQVGAAGFNTGLWTPEFGWRSDEVEAAEDAHLPQLLAAFQCFLWFFVAEGKKAWVHLAAEMQAGKTGVVTALVRLLFANARLLGVSPERVFVITGMNDNAWVKQTKARLPNGMRNGVAHNGGLGKIVRDLKGLAEHAGGLRNVLVVVDESHERAQPPQSHGL